MDSAARLCVGERLYYNVKVEEYAQAINEAGIEDFRGTRSTTIKSHSLADFAEGFLTEHYGVKQSAHSDSRRTNYHSTQAYYRFEGTNGIFNIYDGGNHMWGTWMRLNGWSLEASLKGAQANEFWGDSQADQRAIQIGWYYGTYNPKIL